MAEWIVELGDGNIHIKKMSPLVRCRDCKNYHKAEPTKGDISNISYCTIEDEDLISFPNEDDFCSRGERKDEPKTYTINAGEV